MPAMGTVLEVVDLCKEYDAGGGIVHALHDVSLSVEQGEFVAIMGASGSGKSTLLHLIGGLDKPTSGSIHLEGGDLTAMTDRKRTLFRRRRLGIVFQAYNLLPTLTAKENVLLPAMIDGIDGRKIDRRACELLELVDLGHRLHHRPQALAGGEQQRVAIARAMMNDPALLLADEPTGNLDTRHAEAIWRLLASLAHGNVGPASSVGPAFQPVKARTVLAVTHDPAGATFADRVILLKDGAVAGEIEPGGEGHASLVAARYAELVE